MEEKSNLQIFLDNLKEKKTTILGIIGMVLSLLAMVFPERLLLADQEIAGEIINTGWGMIESIIALIVSSTLLISRIFPKKE